MPCTYDWVGAGMSRSRLGSSALQVRVGWLGFGCGVVYWGGGVEGGMVVRWGEEGWGLFVFLWWWELLCVGGGEGGLLGIGGGMGGRCGGPACHAHTIA
jgi:hypothetical protein